MRITALTENTSISDTIFAEHGLSLLIETKEHNILFDMGQTELFAQNAEQIDIDLSRVDIAVISHGHYDHGGGLKHFLDINHAAPVYINKFAFEPHYNGAEKYIGLDTALQNSSRLIFTDGKTAIDRNLTLYSCNEKIREHNLGSFGLSVMQNGHLDPDDFRHEQYLLIEEDGKRILISGCSHKGIMDIADWFHPDILIGGFHFSKLPLDQDLAEYAKYLNGFDTQYYTCHCTGIEQYRFMKQYMDRLEYIACGQTIII